MGHLKRREPADVRGSDVAGDAQELAVHELLALQRRRQQPLDGAPHLQTPGSSAASAAQPASSHTRCLLRAEFHGLSPKIAEQTRQRRRVKTRRTSSSKGASGMSRLPLTPPLFLMAVRTSSSDSSLRRAPV